MPEGERSRMFSTEPPVKQCGDKEGRADSDNADPVDCGDRAAPWKIIQVRVVPVHYDQHPEEREAQSEADQTKSGRDPLESLPSVTRHFEVNR
jgi:hypothetical protein